jgi:hypothetical protein
MGRIGGSLDAPTGIGTVSAINNCCALDAANRTVFRMTTKYFRKTEAMNIASARDAGAKSTFLSMENAAAEIGVSTQTLRKMCWRGTGPETTRLSEKRLGIRRDVFDAWLEQRTGHHASRGNPLRKQSA